jgi:hypothetical protein
MEKIKITRLPIEDEEFKNALESNFTSIIYTEISKELYNTFNNDEIAFEKVRKVNDGEEYAPNRFEITAQYDSKIVDFVESNLLESDNNLDLIDIYTDDEDNKNIKLSCEEVYVESMKNIINRYVQLSCVTYKPIKPLLGE